MNAFKNFRSQWNCHDYRWKEDFDQKYDGETKCVVLMIHYARIEIDPYQPLDFLLKSFIVVVNTISQLPRAPLKLKEIVNVIGEELCKLVTLRFLKINIRSKNPKEPTESGFQIYREQCACCIYVNSVARYTSMAEVPKDCFEKKGNIKSGRVLRRP